MPIKNQDIANNTPLFFRNAIITKIESRAKMAVKNVLISNMSFKTIVYLYKCRSKGSNKVSKYLGMISKKLTIRNGIDSKALCIDNP